MIGNEGMVGLTAFLGEEEAPNRLIVQVPGAGLRMAADDLRAETSRDSPLRRLLVRYHTGHGPIGRRDQVTFEFAAAYRQVEGNAPPVQGNLLGKRAVVLYFYPKDHTPGCTAEGQGLRDDYASFQSKGVEILGVSFDDPATNAKFVAAYKKAFGHAPSEDAANSYTAGQVLAAAVKAVGSLVGIEIIDHVVIGDTKFRSIAEYAGTTL